MTRITDLPAELLLFITQYLIDGRETGSYFASANRSLSRELLKKVRKINICVTSQKWVSEDTRSKLLQMIDNPYHQFSLCDDRHSFTDIYYSSLFLLPGIDKLQIPASLLPILTNQVNEKKFILKSLEIGYADGWSLDPLPCLESHLLSLRRLVRTDELHLPAYKFLRSLTLYHCDMLEDVSCLDGIHNLILFACVKVRDISTLNNNYRVCISQCNGIKTYSKSFRSSRSVRIYSNSSEVLVSLQSCHSLTSLTIFTKSFIFSDNCMNSLRYLSLSSIQHLKALPPNHLQKVEISFCEHFESLENMDNIRSALHFFM